ncbi:MAG: HD domain-containing protein [Proteobacteria bacterium]|nr:HD domain-containing protein [Pseudomonadota bacterium]
MIDIVNFLFEVGMLKRTPRTGFQFLGSGYESVAEHSLRTVYIAYVLSNKVKDINRERLILISLFHDFLEARTGDLNYMNKKYVTVDEKKALEDAIKGLPFQDEFSDLIIDYIEQKSLEAKLAKDADNLELLLQLKEQKDLGNPYADDWIKFTMQRLITNEGKELGEVILNTDSTHWWFDKSSDWWVNGGGK